MVPPRRSPSTGSQPREFQPAGSACSADLDPIRRFGNDNLAVKEPDGRIWALDIFSRDNDCLDAENAAREQKLLEAWPRCEFNGESWRTHVSRIARSHSFNVVAALAIVANVSLRAVIASLPPDRDEVFPCTVCSAVLMGFFALELVVRWLAPRDIPRAGGFHYMRKEWLVLDEFVLATYLVGQLLGLLRPHSGLQPLSRLLVALQALRLLCTLRLLELLPPVRPLHILLSGVSDGFVNIVSASVFVVVIWLTFSILFTSVLRVGESNEVVATYFSSVPSSMLVMWETTVGGVRWGEDIVRPFFASESTEMHLKGALVLLAILVSTFCLWNLVLGIYVRQAIISAQEFDDMADHTTGAAGQECMRAVKKLLVEVDAGTDADGRISKADLQTLIKRDGALRTMRIKKDELETVHDTLDRECDGNVLINDLLFGILKLAGASKTVDMLSIDYKQKVLLRDLVHLDKESGRQLEQLSETVSEVHDAAERLAGEVGVLKRRVVESQQELSAEMVRQEQLLARERDAAIERLSEQVRARQQREKARRAVEAHIDSLHAQVQKLLWERRVEAVCSSAASSGSSKLRSEVRRQLNSQVQPWLEGELAKMGSASR